MSLNATSTGRYRLVCCPSDLDGVVGKGYTPLRIKEAVVQFCIQVDYHPLLVGPSWVSDSPMFTSQKNVKRDSTDAPEPYLLDRASSKTEIN